MTDLFKRLEIVKTYVGKTQADLAAALGLDAKTCSAYFRAKSPRILLSLPKLFDLIPGLNAEWLYLGKGDPIKKDTSGDCSALRQQVQELSEANRRLAETNQRLVEELLEKR